MARHKLTAIELRQREERTLAREKRRAEYQRLERRSRAQREETNNRLAHLSFEDRYYPDRYRTTFEPWIRMDIKRGKERSTWFSDYEKYYQREELNNSPTPPESIDIVALSSSNP